MAIAPGDGISQQQAIADTIAAQRAAAARAAAEAQAKQDADIAASDARLRARIPSSPNYVAPVVEEPAPKKDITIVPPPGGKTVKNVTFRGTGAGRIKVTEYSDGTFLEEASPVSETITQPATTVTELNKTERLLAKDTFINTLKLTLGAQEASKAYVGQLYNLVSGYYKSGSTEEEALNLAIRDAYENNAIPEFTNRFKGIFELQDKLRAGQAVIVPTVADYIATEAKMGEVLTNAGLGELATQDFLGGVIGKGKSVLEVGNLISDVFTAIDTAPTALKQTLQTYFPGVDRVSMAKAILTGPEGAAALAQKVKGATTLSAAATQGLTVDLATATDIANMGYGYNESLAGFGKVAAGLPTFEKLQEMRLGTNVETSDAQAMLQKSIFGQNIAEQEKMRKLSEEEANRFKATSGILGSKSLASQQRGAGLI